MLDEKLLPIIESTIGIPLQNWQKEYIIGKDVSFIEGRGTGKTIAYILRIIFSTGDPIHLYRKDVLIRLSAAVGSRTWFYNNLRDSYYKLADPKLGLPIRKIYFARSEYAEDRRR